MTTADYANMTLTITETSTRRPVTSDSVRTGSRTYTWRANTIKSSASEPSESSSNGLKTYTAKYRNNSTGIIFTRSITAGSSTQARAQAKSWQKGQGDWYTFVGVDGAPGEFFKKTSSR